MDLDNDKDTLVQMFTAMTLAVDDYTNASGDVEKRGIGEKLTELLVEIQRVISRSNPAFITAAFTPSVCKAWFTQFGRMSARSDHYDLTRSIIKSFFASLNPGSFFDQYSSVVASHLADEKCSADSKEFILNEVSSALERADMESIQRLNSGSSQELLPSIAQCLSDQETSLFESATKALVKLCKRQPVGATVLFSSQQTIQRLRTMLSGKAITANSCTKDTLKFRLYEFIGAISIIDDQCLNMCNDAGFIDPLLKEVDSNDILGQLNALTILTEMAAPKSGSDHCLRHFRDKGLLQKLNGMLLLSREAPDATFLFPAVVKFFGHLSRVYPKECCEDFPLFLSCVFDLVINYYRLDVGQRLLAFDTLGLIGSTPAGKLILAKHDETMKKCMSAFGSSFKQGPIELRVRHIEALGFLIDLKESDQTDALLSLTKQWFGWLEHSGQPSDGCKLIFDLFQQPFPEIHLAAGNIFSKLAVQPWGRTLMAQQGGLVEYLLNRSTEHTVEGRFVKYEIIKCLVDCPTIGESFDQADILRLKTYVQEGPLYVKAQPPGVALEEA